MAVFLSYHNSRSETVEHVANYLARHQIDAWYAPRDIPPGAVWHKAIFDAIRQSDALVLLFDSSADNSEHVQREVGIAADAGIPIRWLRLEDVQPTGLGYFLNTQWIDWLDKRDESLARLVRSLSRDTQAAASPTSTATPPAPAPPSPVPNPPEKREALTPYTEWQPRQLAAVADASIDQIVDGLVEIVTAEGPILSQRAYRIYVRASGGQRVGKNVEDILTRATERAVHSGRLAQIKDHLRKEDKTLYLPGTPCAVPRPLGPRALTEVPRSEIQHLVTALGLSVESVEVPRAVAGQLGIKRLTDEAVDFINDCLAYQYETQSDEAPVDGDDRANLESCGDDEQCRLCRLQTVLAEATGLAAETYSVGAVVMFPPDRVVAVQRASLWVDSEHIRLSMTPAELAAQYKWVYSDPKRVEALIALADHPGWELNANFHLGFRFAQPRQRWYPAQHLSGPVYVRQWIDDLQEKRAGGRTREQLKDPSFRRWIVKRGYADESELPMLDEWLNERPAGTQLHIRPSVGVRKSWQLADAVARDSAGEFVGEVRGAIDQVLAALDEPRLDVFQPES